MALPLLMTTTTTTMNVVGIPTPDNLEEASAALAGGGEAISRRPGRPRQLVLLYCRKVPKTFDKFLNKMGRWEIWWEFWWGWQDDDDNGRRRNNVTINLPA